MVYACQSDLSSTRFLIQKLKMCYDKWIATNIGPHCQECAGGSYGQKELIQYTNYCFTQTWEFSKFVGALEDWRHLDYPRWKHDPISWTVTPAIFRMKNELYCYNRSLRPDSFCTLTEEQQSGPSKLQRTQEGQYVSRERNMQG